MATDSDVDPAGNPFPDLAVENARLEHARACRDRMIARLERVDPQAAADEITAEYVEVTVWEALEDLRSPGAGDFFGRIDEPSTIGRPIGGTSAAATSRTTPTTRSWSTGGRRSPRRSTAPPRSTRSGVAFRRRFTLADGELTAYLDEHLDDPDAGDVAAGIPDPVLAEIGAARTGAMREIVATIQAEQDVVIRADIDQALIVQGGPGTGKTAVALHRAAYLLFEHRAPAGPRRRARGRARTGRSSTTSATCCRRSASAACASAQRSTCAFPKVAITGCRRRRDGAVEGRRRAARRARGGVRSTRSSHRPTTSGCRSARARTCSTRDEIARWVVAAKAAGRADQPATRAAAGARPAGAAPAVRRRRRVAERRAAASGAQQGVADAAADHASSTRSPARARAASGGRGRPPTSTSSTRPTRCSTARRSPTATSSSTRRRTTRRSRCG